VIKDKEIMSTIGQDWVVVRKLESRMSSKKYLAGGRIWYEDRPEESYNLLLILAYSVLGQVLFQLQNEEVIAKKVDKVGYMMKVSKNTLPWQDYNIVDKGREARNNLAHGAILVEKNDCLKYINAIEVELKAWEVI